MQVSQITSDGLKKSLQIKAAPGALYSITGYNTGPAQYIAIYDKATTPTVGDKPKLLVKVATETSFYWDFTQIARQFTAGIFIGNTSTAASFTAGADDCLFDAMYV